jgi:hypothetical protein
MITGVSHWLTPAILATWECENRRIMGQGSMHKEFFRPHLQITRSKCPRGVTQVIKCMLCKCEALNSNPTHTKKKKN